VIGAIVSEQNRQKYTQQLDLKGLACPMPLLKMKLALKQLEPEQLIYVETTDSGSWADFHKFAEITSNELVSAEKVAGDYQFVIKKGL
jgi:tRNA 2-thiouridine synthesizing protein A